MTASKVRSGFKRAGSSNDDKDQIQSSQVTSQTGSEPEVPSIQAHASIWALGATFLACTAYTVMGAALAEVLGAGSWLRDPGNFVISFVPAVYFTAFCTLVALASRNRLPVRIGLMLGAFVLPALLFVPVPGVASDGDGPAIYWISTNIGSFVGSMTPFPAPIIWFLTTAATAAALASAPVLLIELSLPRQERLRLWLHWLGILGAGVIIFGLFMISVNWESRYPAALGFLAFTPHVIAVGGFRSSWILLRSHLSKAGEGCHRS